MNWDAFARDLKEKWGTLDPPARAAAVRRWKNESHRSNRQLALLLGKSEAALRAVLSSVNKKNELHRASEGARSGQTPCVGSQPRSASKLTTHPNPVPASIEPATSRKIAAPTKPAAVSTVVGQIIAWIDKLQLADQFCLMVIDDIRFQLHDNARFVKSGIRAFGVPTLELRPPDLQPDGDDDLPNWGPWLARFLCLHPERDAIVTQLKEHYLKAPSLR